MLNIEDLVRTPAEFTLSNGETFHLKPMSLEDEAWMAKTFGKDVEKIFKEVRLEELSRIAFRLMTNEQKELLKPTEVTEYGEDGTAFKKQLGGAALFRTKLVDIKDRIAMLNALLETIGFSRPVQEQLAKELSDEKKSPMIGDTSSTLSAPSTDGQPSTP